MMLTEQQNERLTQVGKGTPAGELLRRYWWPVACSAQVEPEAVVAVRLLGEDLALYRTESGKLGLLGDRCAHRGVSLVYGIPEEDGIRCSYHGWRYDASGQCTDMPGEPPEANFRNRICIPGYPIEELGGLIFAYLGPKPAPLLPRWDVLVRVELKREVGITSLPINWVAMAENAMDPYHLDYLHTRYMNYVMKRAGKQAVAAERRHVKIDFEVWEYGIMKRRLLEGDDPETSEEWLVGHPLVFPSTLALGGAKPRLGIRVPVDDTHTMNFAVFTEAYAADEAPQSSVPFYEVPYKREDGTLIVETVIGQDMMASVTQGAITDRTIEHLGTTDKGIILYRKLFEEQIERVARGEDPIGIVRDKARNTPMISLPLERDAFFTHTGGMVGDQNAADDPLALIRVRKELGVR
jgi:5,5'-dehydrodivanillate O-demethylase oxygenase subunit